MRQIRVLVTGLGIIAAGFAGGCGQPSPTPLPELTRVARPLLSPAEQQRAIADLEAEGARARSASGASAAKR